jgi:hypothetical protein
LARKFLAAAVIVIGALALAAGYRYLRPADLKPIGGEWYIKSESAYWFGHSSNWDDLYRKSGLWFVRVDSHVSVYRYYPPDCVLFESGLNKIRERTTGMAMTDVVVAACGAHNPIALELNAGGSTLYEEEGLRTFYRAGYSQRAGAWQPASSEVTPIARIRELASQQPSYRRDWREHASFEMKMY